MQCTADTLADVVLITTAHAWQHQGKTLFISRKTYRIDGHGEMVINVDVAVASDTPHPARIGLTCQLAQVVAAGKLARPGAARKLSRPPYCSLF
ncbi:hypothetical protein [Escherichia coli]|uniref:hypothetical protein n=1 Tax=Escherichia coli TaxID=562 RepID=UPI00388E60EB